MGKKGILPVGQTECAVVDTQAWRRELGIKYEALGLWLVRGILEALMSGNIRVSGSRPSRRALILL